MWKKVIAGMYMAENVKALDNSTRSFKVQAENGIWQLFCYEKNGIENTPVEYWGDYKTRGDAENAIREWVVGK